MHDDGVRGLVLLMATDLTGVDDDDGNGEFTIDDGPGDVNDSLGGGSGNSVSSTVIICSRWPSLMFLPSRC